MANHTKINPDNIVNEQESDSEQELKLLRERAKTMGIPISGNIGLDTLKERIANHINNEAKAAPEPVVEKELTRKQLDQQIRKKMQLEQLALVRCRIYNLNPSKRDLRGEFITVANKYMGTVRKFIPFGDQTDGGYHIPVCILNDLKSRKFQQLRTRNVKGTIQAESRMVPEFSIEIMPQLTKEELHDLAVKQAAAERVGTE